MVSIKHLPRSLRGYFLFLTGINCVVHSRTALDMPRGNFVRILKTLAGMELEVSRLLGVSRAYSEESMRMSLVPDWSNCVVYNTKLVEKHIGISIQI